MKKIISLIIVTVLCLGMLASCSVIDTVKGWFGGEEDTGLSKAVTFLNGIYEKRDGSTTTVDFDVVAQVVVDGVKYPVTWTSNNDKVVVRESTTTGYYTIDLPDVNEEEFTYTLTATVADSNGNTDSKSYTFKMPVVNNEAVVTDLKEGVAYKIFLMQGKFNQRFYALNTAQNGTGEGESQGKFINTTVDPSKGADFYVEIVDGGYKWYTEVDGVKTYVYAQTLYQTEADREENHPSKYIGFSTENASVFSYNADMGGVWTVTIEGYVYGVGTYNTFKTICLSDNTFFSPSTVGSSQFVVQFITSEYANTLEPDEEVKVDLPAANSTLTIPEAIELGEAVVGYTTDKYYVSGTVTEIANETYGNMYIEDESGNKIYIYGTYDATGANRFDAMATKPAVGDTVTVYGVVGNYNDVAQLQNAWITAINGENFGGGETPAPSLGVVDPVAGTAYKFGMVQGNLNATYFLAGGMNGYYMATTTDVNAAIDVYLEATEGGYYLYTLDNAGAKLYINMVVSGTHVNGAYEATASTVYTYDSDRKSIVATVNDELYHFGTRNDNTYNTVGPCKVSYNGFDCQFYAAGNGSTPSPEPSLTGKPLLDAAYALQDGESMTGPYTLTGVITALDNYNNPTIVIGNYTDMPIYCYKLKDDSFVVGATITVTAQSIKNYQGTIEMMDCTLDSIVLPGEGDGDSDETPDGPIEMTIPEVLLAEVGTEVIVKGTVSGFYEVWSSFNNCSPYIVDENGNVLLIFRTATQVTIGDEITVTGTVAVYNNVNQIAQGSTVVIDVAHVCSEWKDATCTKDAECVLCGKAKENTALGHTEANAEGKCDRCEIDLSISYASASLSFSDKANRTSQTTDQQIWEQNGVKLINDKGASTSNVADYAAPARFYKSSKLTIEYTGIVKIEFVCNTASYATALQNSIAVADGITVSVDGQVVTVEFASAVNSFVVESLTGGQVRMDSLTVYVIA